MLRLHIFPIFSFLAKILSSLCMFLCLLYKMIEKLHSTMRLKEKELIYCVWFRSPHSTYRTLGDCIIGTTFHYGSMGSTGKWRWCPAWGLQSGCAWWEASHVDGSWSRVSRCSKTQGSRTGWRQPLLFENLCQEWSRL